MLKSQTVQEPRGCVAASTDGSDWTEAQAQGNGRTVHRQCVQANGLFFIKDKKKTLLGEQYVDTQLGTGGRGWIWKLASGI